jgi:hypothetical protein
MPPNPANFRFQAVDGRGRQDLIRDPRNGGVAVVQIDDRQGGHAESVFVPQEVTKKSYNFGGRRTARGEKFGDLL